MKLRLGRQLLIVGLCTFLITCHGSQEVTPRQAARLTRIPPRTPQNSTRTASQQPLLQDHERDTFNVQEFPAAQHGMLLPAHNAVPILPTQPPATQSLTLVQELLHSGRYFHLLLKENLLIASTLWGIEVYRFAAATGDLTLLSRSPTEGQARWSTLVNQFLYVADDYAGIALFDLTDPSAPRFLGSERCSGDVKSVTSVGEILYACAHSGGLDLFQILPTGTLQKIKNLDTPGKAFHLEVSGNIGILSDGAGSIIVLDLTEPRSPIVTQQVTTSEFALHASAMKNWVVVADRRFGVRSYLLTPETGQLKLQASLKLPTETRQILLHDERVYVVSEKNIYCITREALDSGQGRPEVILKSDYEYRFLLLHQDMLVVSESDLGIAVHSMNGELLADHRDRRIISKVAINHDLAAVAAGWDGLYFLSQKQGAAFICAHVTTRDKVESLDWSNDRILYVADRTGLTIYDVSNELNPILMGAWQSPGEATGLDSSDGIVVLADWFEGMSIIDVRNPSEPKLVGQLALERGWAIDVLYQPPLAYLCCVNNGLLTVDLENPAAPKVLDRNTIVAAPEGLYLKDSWLYVPDFNSGLVVYDLRNQRKPQAVCTYPCGIAKGITGYGATLYVANYFHGIKLFDITLPNQPTLIAEFDTHGKSYDVVKWRDLLLVADWHDLAVLTR